jgi:hypothetical protein
MEEQQEDEGLQDNYVLDQDSYNPFDKETDLEEASNTWDPFADAHKIEELHEKREQQRKREL